MKVLVCEVCENRGLTKNGDLYVCPSCGASFPAADVKKLLVEVADAPAPAVSAPAEESKEDKYLLLARQAAEAGNYAEAAKYYSMAKEYDPKSWECVFYVNYYKAMDTNIAGIVNACNLVKNAIPVTVNLLKDLAPVERATAASQLAKSVIDLFVAMSTAAKKHYNSIDSSIRYSYLKELSDRQCAAMFMACELVDQLGAKIPGDKLIDEVRALVCKPVLTFALQEGGLEEKKVLEYLKLQMAHDPKTAKPRIQEKIRMKSSSVEALSETHHNEPTAFGVFLGIALINLVLAIVIGNMQYASGYSVIFYLMVVVSVIFAIYSVVPKRYPQAELDRRAREVKRYKKEIEELQEMLK